MNAKVEIIQRRYVAPENVSTFIERESVYWSAVALYAIENGKMAEWSLWERVGGVDGHGARGAVGTGAEGRRWTPPLGSDQSGRDRDRSPMIRTLLPLFLLVGAVAAGCDTNAGQDEFFVIRQIILMRVGVWILWLTVFIMGVDFGS